MPRRKFIDKKNATTFSLVHRPQTDPLIHDPSASDRIFTGIDTSQSKARSRKVKQRGDLDAEFGLSIRDNEGEAANYDIFYDDTEYDYMQHLRDLGGGTESHFVEASQAQSKQKGKGKEKQSLEDALRQVSMDDGNHRDAESLSGMSLSDSHAADSVVRDTAYVKRRTLEAQQDIPDAIAGFQPDMDPRLREVLEALEDEAYVDDEDDIFAELAQDGEEIDTAEWETPEWEYREARGIEGEEDGGWETDDTAKPSKEYNSVRSPPQTLTQSPPSKAPIDTTTAVSPGAQTADSTNDAWLHEFSKFKKDLKSSSTAPRAMPQPAGSSSIVPSSVLTSGRRKKRKGALTSSTGYSMTSSSLQRTAQHTLLDRRFEKIEEQYALDDDEDAFADADEDDISASGLSAISRLSKVSAVSGVSNMSEASRTSEAPSLVDAAAAGSMRSDFDNIMDDFLDGYGVKGRPGRQRVKRGAAGTGMMQLDEIRRGLGPARIDGRA